MLADIITIGDEILIGQIVDTNSAYISDKLNKIGVKVYQITSVQDEKAHILQAFKEAKQHANLVIVTGGLGPTKDDITKETFCDFFDDTLVQNKEVHEHIKMLFKKYQLSKPLPANFQQAMVPAKAEVLMNQHGTAPGMWIDEDDVVFISLPGVPYEMKHLMEDVVLAKIISRFERPFIYHKTLLTYGLGESSVAHRIAEWENNLPDNISLAYLPSFGRVRLRLSSKGKDENQVRAAVDSQMDTLQNLLADIAVGFENETSIAEVIGNILTEKGQSYSVAESCTGGRIASEITKSAGASNAFMGGVIPYDTNLKTKVLGVPKQIIDKYNVVSAQVAEAMAKRCAVLFESEYAIATTGIAGPTKGDGDAEIGTVYIAIASPRGVFSNEFNFGKDRSRVINKATNKALEMLLKEISKN